MSKLLKVLTSSPSASIDQPIHPSIHPFISFVDSRYGILTVRPSKNPPQSPLGPHNMKYIMTFFLSQHAFIQNNLSIKVKLASELFCLCSRAFCSMLQDAHTHRHRHREREIGDREVYRCTSLSIDRGTKLLPSWMDNTYIRSPTPPPTPKKGGGGARRKNRGI